jgi:type III secretion protein J
MTLTKTLAPLALLLLAACQEELQRDLSSPQAQELLWALRAEGIDAQAQGQDRVTVSAPAPQAPAARLVMAARGLPRRDPEGLRALLEDRPLLPSPQQERLRHQAALGGELERSLMALDGVLDARVHLNLPDPGPRARPLDQPALAPSAAVLLKVHPDARLPPPEELQGLIAASTQGLQPAQVTLVLQRAALPAAPAPRWASLGPLLLDPQSLAPLRWALGGALALIALQAAAIAALVLRRRARP